MKRRQGFVGVSDGYAARNTHNLLLPQTEVDYVLIGKYLKFVSLRIKRGSLLIQGD
jgi:hypothetical protein